MGKYEELIKRSKKISNLKQISKLLRWDQEVIMPPKGVNARSQQLSTVSSIKHKLISDKKTANLLEDIDKKELDEEGKAVIRELEKDHKRSKKVPEKLIKKISKTASESFEIWKKAKQKDSFETFSPKLKELVELKKNYARKIDPNLSPYEVLFQDYEPYLSLSKTEDILYKLESELPKIINDRKDREINLNLDWSEKKQESVCRDILDLLGYDWKRGRIDTSPHPFSSGNQFDTRITTKYVDSTLDSIMSTIHEFGHALYNLNLPQDHYGTPLGEPREMIIHESQSRFWENHIGRSSEFWDFLVSELSLNIPSEEIYRYLNKISPGNIRTEADELTYHMHILVRFDIERKIFREEIKISEVPQVWNQKMEEYLGVSPENDSEGCLQDIHWSHGSFGYFPCYTLGSVLSAQIYSSLNQDLIENKIKLGNKIKNGSFGIIRNWLKENFHKHGKKYPTDDLIEKATGSPLSSEDFLKYVRKKYS